MTPVKIVLSTQVAPIFQPSVSYQKSIQTWLFSDLKISQNEISSPLVSRTAQHKKVVTK
jgi:hypothetical protein